MGACRHHRQEKIEAEKVWNLAMKAIQEKYPQYSTWNVSIYGDRDRNGTFSEKGNESNQIKGEIEEFFIVFENGDQNVTFKVAYFDMNGVPDIELAESVNYTSHFKTAIKPTNFDANLAG